MRPRRFTVLITAISRRVTLVHAFRSALAGLGLEGRVVVTDVNPLSPGVHLADRAYRVPLSTADEYVPAILDVCRREAVELLVPTIDDELPLFAARAEEFASHGTRVVVSPYDTAVTCNDKVATCRQLQAAGISAAASYPPAELPLNFGPPYFVKPRVGRGGVGAFAARTVRELDFFLHYVPDPCVQEYLEGPEFTLDVFCDFSGQIISVVPRERVVIRAGVIDRGRTVGDLALIELGVACSRALPFVGPVNIQCRLHDGRPTVFEINPRFSGGIGLTIRAGADFPRWLVELALGRPVPSALGEFDRGLWMTSYESALFLDEGRLLTLSPPETEPPPGRSGDR